MELSLVVETEEKTVLKVSNSVEQRADEWVVGKAAIMAEWSVVSSALLSAVLRGYSRVVY